MFGLQDSAVAGSRLGRSRCCRSWGHRGAGRWHPPLSLAVAGRGAGPAGPHAAGPSDHRDPRSAGHRRGRREIRAPSGMPMSPGWPNAPHAPAPSSPTCGYPSATLMRCATSPLLAFVDGADLRLCLARCLGDRTRARASRPAMPAGPPGKAGSSRRSIPASPRSIWPTSPRTACRSRQAAASRCGFTARSAR